MGAAPEGSLSLLEGATSPEGSDVVARVFERTERSGSEAYTLRRELLAMCGVVVGDDRCDWGVIARHAHRDESLDGLRNGDVVERGARADRTAWVLRVASDAQWDAAYERADVELAAAREVGARLTTVLDEDYPLNLGFVFNLPPFLFYRGEFDAAADARSVAVVGTRTPTSGGLGRADRMARSLAEHDVTVTSGLALGVDTAAHRAALKAGGRTIAVYGTGITRVYPSSNGELAEEIIAGGGLVVSQFLPTAEPKKWMFKKRNEVTSGISQGTVVIEASKTSGAKMQARLAWEHGKRVFLVDSLVSTQEWAKKMLEEGKAIPVKQVEDVVSRIVPTERLSEASRVLRIRTSML